MTLDLSLVSYLKEVCPGLPTTALGCPLYLSPTLTLNPTPTLTLPSTWDIPRTPDGNPVMVLKKLLRA